MKIPDNIIEIFETEINGYEYGESTLTVHRRGSNIRYTIGRERTFLHDTCSKELKKNVRKESNTVKCN